MRNESFLLDSEPAGAIRRSVVASPGRLAARDGLRVTFTDELARNGVWGVDYVDQPTFVELPIAFLHGRISVDIASRLRPDAPEEARGFAGIAYRIADDASTFEAAYLRPANGLRVVPDGPRRDRAVQYFAYPDWPFDRLREQFPGGYESSADIALERWIRLSVTADFDRTVVEIDGEVRIEIAEPLVPARTGRVGLFVDIGTDAVFRDLFVEHFA